MNKRSSGQANVPAGGKIRLAVLFGGRSTEHAVSCVSAEAIIKNLDSNKYDIVPVGITQEGHWLPYSGPVELLPGDKWLPLALSQNGLEGKLQPGSQINIGIGIRTLETCDCILPVLHGQNGEDGTVQGLFELLDIPYVGCGIFASAAGMDKSFTKVIFNQAGIPQARYMVSRRIKFATDPDALVKEIGADISYPCFVKPANCGSSVGVSKVKAESELVPALAAAHEYDSKVLVEEFIEGREIECAVLGNSVSAYASAPGEIKPSKEFYDYEDKYESGKSFCVIPAEIPAETAAKVRSLALKAFHAIDGSGLSRVDFFLRPDGSLVLNEINTLPGFTEISMYSKLLINDGMTYSGLLDRLIELAFEEKALTKRCTQ